MQGPQTLRGLLQQWRPAGYDQLPDIDLYKDQVLAYMQRQQAPGAAQEELTGAMVNNYIKNGVLPRPQGKRYGRQHLAVLTAVCQLKQVLSVGEAGQLLAAQPDAPDPAALYGRYLDQLDEALGRTAALLPEADPATRQEAARCALALAVQGYACRLAARELLALMEKLPAQPPPAEDGPGK